MDTLKTIWEDLNNRLRSPFAIAFTLSWIAWNWWLIYSLCNFPENYALDYRLYYIKYYLIENKWGPVSIYPLLTCIVVTVLFYFFKLGFLWLDSMYENKWRVFVIKKAGLSEMVPIEDLEKYSREIELLRKDIRDKDSLHATVLADKYQTVSELNDAKKENETLQRVKSINEELLHENGHLKKELDKHIIEFPKTLSEFFYGHWVCEYQIMGKEIEIGYEIFFINDVEYRIDGKIGFKIENVLWYRQQDFLVFTKRHMVHTINANKMKLVKQNENLWIGLEDLADGRKSYIRMFSIANMPENYHFLLNRDAADKAIVGTQTSIDKLNNFKNMYSGMKQSI